MKTSIKMIAIAVATLASGSAFAASDVSSVSSASVSSGSVIVTSGNGAAYSNQIAGSHADNTSVAGASGSNDWVSSNAQTLAASKGTTEVVVVSQSGSMDNAIVLGGAIASANQAGTADASKLTDSFTGYSKANSNAVVASSSNAAVINNGSAGAEHTTFAINGSNASQNPATTTADSVGVTSNIVDESYNYGYSIAGSTGIVGETGDAKGKIW